MTPRIPGLFSQLNSGIIASTMRRTFTNLSKDDLRNIPSYGMSEAAHYLCIPRSTITYWVLGRPSPQDPAVRDPKPVIQRPHQDSNGLSFINLVELHVLDGLRRGHHIPLPTIRNALDFLVKEFPSSLHPLIDSEFETDGVNLFITELGHLINITAAGQLAIRECVKQYLRRVERDSSGIPLRLFPFTMKDFHSTPKTIVIDPHVSYGRPAIVRRGVATAIIAERLWAGESSADLRKDYDLKPEELDEAIRCELRSKAA